MSWPHAPIHRLEGAEAVMITAATVHKQHLWPDPPRLNLLQDFILEYIPAHGWNLQAWAIFSNHYHFVAVAEPNALPMSDTLTQLHADSARELNKLDNEIGRQIWFQFWDTALTYQTSYLARLHYTHTNPVHHQLVLDSREYPWGSASWFERTASSAFQQTVQSFKIDSLRLKDEYSPILDGQ